MRLHQTWKNYVSQVLLERDIPLLTEWVRHWLVSVHVDVFAEHSERDGEARRPHLESFYDAHDARTHGGRLPARAPGSRG